MKINIISHSDLSGGAARAAYRLHNALNKSSNIKSEMIVRHKVSDDFLVISPSKIKQIYYQLINYLAHQIIKLQKTKNNNLHSINIFGSSIFNYIQESDADIINLHWVNGETLSIKQISNINKPIIMTLHDMWAFSGSEHLSIDSDFSEFRLGYNKKTSDSDYISGLDLNKFTWNRKKFFWNDKFTIVTPSRWLSQCARESDLFKDWDIYTIPNALNTNIFKPMDKNIARDLCNIPRNMKVIGFGAIGGGKDKNKGFDLLQDALKHLSVDHSYQCIVFGQSKPKEVPDLGLPISFIGHLHDDISLVAFYNAIDVMVVPSRQENLPQTATEAQSCGTPVVAFNTTGFSDAIEHKITGYLAIPFETGDLAYGIKWVVDNPDSIDFARNTRSRAVSFWSEDVVVKQYKELYSLLLT